MTRKTLLFLWCLMIIVCAVTFNVAQKSPQAVSIVGCYTDLREISEGIIGNGVIKIAKENGKYVGTFAELSNELGLAYDEVPLENISVDKSKLTIKFDVKYNRYQYASTRGRISGKITKTGIKMNWGEGGGEYGTANSFMKRDKNCY